MRASMAQRAEARAFNSLPGPIVQIMRRVLNRRVASQEKFRTEVENKIGIEIGGPSNIFGNAGELPIYRSITRLDNCVFSRETIWEGRREEGKTFTYLPGKTGFNFIREATDLNGVRDNTYDFLLSSHSLEHSSNPIKALKEWVRVVKPSGAMIIVLPHYRYTFDHRRKPTPVQHLLDDYTQETDERDLSHLPEILELHDLELDPGGGNMDHFRERSLKNFENRCLHQHVFDEKNSQEMMTSAGLTVVEQEFIRPHHIVLLGRCPPA